MYEVHDVLPDVNRAIAFLSKFLGVGTFAVTMLAATASQASSSTAEFMDKLTLCAGGIEISIDANLLGSVRSIYDGDKTEGKAHLKTVAAFMQYIPDKDRYAALKLYNKCIASLVGDEFQIRQEGLDVRFMALIPTDLVLELNDRNLDTSYLWQSEGLFYKLFNPLSIYYRISRNYCEWKGLDYFNGDYNYYYSHGFRGSTHPSVIGYESPLVTEKLGLYNVLFAGLNWNSKNVASTTVPKPDDMLTSVEQLRSKCLYISIYTSYPYGLTASETDTWIKKYAGEIFKSIKLNGFSIQFNDEYKFDLISGHYREVFSGDLMKIWEAPLPSEVNGLRIQ